VFFFRLIIDVTVDKIFIGYSNRLKKFKVHFFHLRNVYDK